MAVKTCKYLSKLKLQNCIGNINIKNVSKKKKK